MIQPFIDEGLGNSSYLIDLGDGSALVVDPFRDPRPYLQEARRHGLRLRFVAETHLHADFVSGARELANEEGATVLASAGGKTQFHHRPLRAGEELDLGGLTLRVLATPGHTPEHVSFLLVDHGPTALFSGGALIVGGVARTDLVAAEQTEPLARAAWRSIQEQLARLPDDLRVYPTHGSGSFCSAGRGDERTTTIGVEKRLNPLLQAGDEDEFVHRLIEGPGTFPPYFLVLREINRRGPALYGNNTPHLVPLTVREVDRALADGGILVDARPIQRFSAGYVPGALSLELRPQFGVWLGWVIEDLETPLVFVVDNDQDRDCLVRQCLQVGFENLVGELAGGVTSWETAGRELDRTRLTDRPISGRALLDVRQRNEWEAGHVPVAIHLELGDLASDSEGRLPPGPLLTHCVHGQRAMTAASLLQRAGFHDVTVFRGGPREWEEASSETSQAP